MMDRLEQALGVLSLLVFAMAGGFSLRAIAATIAPKWRRIWRLATGHIDPVIPAASLAFRASSSPSRRGVEAAAAPAYSSDRNPA